MNNTTQHQKEKAASKIATHDVMEIKGVNIMGRQGAYDVTIKDKCFKSISPSNDIPTKLLLPLLVDCHVHLDKTYTDARCKGEVKSLFDAIDLMEKDKVNWHYDDLYERADKALMASYKNGIVALRTHVDWLQATPPIAWQVMLDLKDKWQGKITLQLAALAPLDLYEGNAEIIARRVAETKSVLGAFIYRNENLEAKLQEVFEAAREYDLDLDFHVDEGLDIEANGFDVIVKFAQKYGNGERILCGHCCSLSIREKDEVDTLLKRAGEQKIGLTILPTTNAWLQDQMHDRTPRYRGIAPIKEAIKNDMQVMIALDNCQDPFYPYGNYDLLDAYRNAVFSAQLKPSKYFDCITKNPASRMGLENYNGIAEGAVADCILLDATSLEDWISNPTISRKVIRNSITINQ